MYAYAHNLWNFRTKCKRFYRHYAIGANEVVETPVFPFLIFSTSYAVNSSKVSGFATDN